jgi:hypothetical protein
LEGLASTFENITKGLASIGEFLGNILSFLNPFDENFILTPIFEVLGELLSYINPFSENFFVYKLIDLLGDLLELLFVPSEERLQAIPNTIKSKFAFIDSIITSINSLKDIINNLGNAPAITLNLGATKYTSAMNIKVIDMSFYAPFKNYGDLIITGFFYVFYLWRLFVNISNILNGVPNLYDVSAQFTDIQAYSKFGFGRRRK